MNSSIQKAAELTGNVTAKDLRDFLKRSPGKGWSRSFVSLHGEAAYNRDSWHDSFVFRCVVAWRKGSIRNEIREEMSLPGHVTNGHTSEIATHKGSDGGSFPTYSESFRPTSGFWALYSSEKISDLLELLPKDAKIAFSVRLDAGTTEGLILSETKSLRGGPAQSGLHADSLYLIASYSRGGKEVTKEFLVDYTVGPHNTARFGYPTRY